LLEKDTQLRYQTATGVISDLRRLVVAGESPVKQPRSKRPLVRFLVGCVIGLSLFAAGDYFFFGEKEKAPQRTMLAVLPFENLGAPEDEYFADGITDEITTSLARLSGLGVISRTSAMQYKDTDKSLRQIGKELKVDCVLEGTISWDKSGDNNRVRINPQLIRVDDDVHLWANRYDAVLTDVFALQSTIAREVAAALDVALLQSEQDALTDRPDVDPAAYDYYLRGKQFFSVARYHQKELRTAEKMQLKAIELAPRFAPAYAELASLYTEMNWDGVDTSQAILDSAKVLIDIALDLAPDDPEVCQALGWYYYHGLLDFDKALDAFSKVLRWQPNNTLAIASIAWVERRRGEWQKAVDGLHRAAQLDPREAWYYHELGNTYSSCRRFEEAIESYEQAIDLEPTNEWSFFGRSWATLNITGDPTAALQVVNEGLVYNPHSPSLTYMAVYYHLCAGDYDSALSLITGPKDFYLWQYGGGVDYYYMKGVILAVLLRPDEAAIYFDSARVILEPFIAAEPDMAMYQSTLGKIYASLDRKDEAIAAAQRGIELLPVDVDALDGPTGIREMAIVYARVDEPDLAVDYLDSLLSIPSEVSVNWLRIAPEFISLRDHPRFQALIEKYETIHRI
jgi:TolB-like protein